MLGHRTRVRPHEMVKPHTAYRFFLPHSCVNEEKHLIRCGLPADLAKLIDRANRHEQSLSLLGILPNQLRTILRTSDKVDEMMLDLSKTLFWKGYDLWVLRKNLTKEFWKNVAPEEWKSHKKKKKERKRNNSKAESKGKAKRQRKSRRNKKSEITDCVDPFHFLTKCEALSKERETKCLCSRFHRPKKRKAELNIENFMTVFPKLHPMSSRDIELLIRQKA